MADPEIENRADSSGSTDDGYSSQPLGNYLYWADTISGLIHYRRVPRQKILIESKIREFDEKMHCMLFNIFKELNCAREIDQFIKCPENCKHPDISIKFNQLQETEDLIRTQCCKEELKEISLFWRAILCDYHLTARLLVKYIDYSGLNEPWGTREPARIDPQWTPLDVLVQQPISDELLYLTKLMLEYRADIRTVDSYGQCILHLASTEPSIDLMKLLLKKIADNNIDIIDTVNKDGKTPLLAVADRGFKTEDQDKIISLLVGRKAKVDAKDNECRNILHLLKSCRHDLLEDIIAKGASLKDCEKSYNYQPIHMAILAGDNNLLTSYIKLGADTNARAKDGIFPLYLAAKLNDPTKLKILLCRGAYTTYKTDQGHYKSRTALHAACMNFNDKSIVALLSNNADVQAEDDDGKTPFDLIDDKFTSLEHDSIKMMIKKLVEKEAPLPSSKKSNEELIRYYKKEIFNLHLHKNKQLRTQ